jgi:HK97 gp10 family phage protein
MARPGGSIKLKVNIVGMDEVIGKLNKFDVEARKAVRTQVRKSANAIRKGAQQRVPVDSGRLKKSIRARYSSDGFSAEIAPGLKWRAHFIEFGTLKMAAHPYMMPAWEQERPNYIAGVKQAIRGAVKK